MRKVILFTIIVLAVSSFAGETILEPGFTLNSMRTLGKGNANVANAYGLESFEYNPAGLRGDKEITILSLNYALISNIFKLKEDMIDIYNEYKGTSYDILALDQIMFFMQQKNIDATVDLFIKQVTEPYGDSVYANGYGIQPILSAGIVNNGFGLGLAIGLDAEAYGSSIATAEFHSVLSTTVLIGYAISLDFKLFKVDAGISARPMYNIRGIAPASEIVAFVASQKKQAEFLRDINYLTGFGVGFDFGVKLTFMDLVAGASVTDINNTTISYSNNSYKNITSGSFIGSEESSDTYVTPMALNLGVAYNPNFGPLSGLISPKLSADYKIDISAAEEIENHEYRDDFLPNLSIGLDLEIFSFISLRTGLNQGYMTIGAGLDLWMLDINAAVYSWELGSNPGDRQQMGAGIEVALRL